MIRLISSSYSELLTRPVIATALLAVVVIASRLPFLGTGYGLDADAWRVAWAAQSIAAGGEYVASRLPGYPVQELASSLLIQGGPWALNGASALFSVVAVIFFAMTLRTLGFKDHLVGGLALAFTPLVYVNSVSSMDYVWALAFMMASLYYIITARWVIAGIFLGLAIGCRITSAALLLPLAWLTFYRKPARPLVSILKLTLGALLIGTIAFLPLIFKYGWDFLTFVDPSYPDALRIIRMATVQVWGRIGLSVILAALLGMAFWRGVFTERTGDSRLWLLSPTPWLLAIGVYYIIFLRLPHDAGYLIPTVPFVILLLARYLRRRFFAIVTLALILSCFVSISRSRGICRGSVLYDRATRIENMTFARKALAAADVLPEKSVVVSGWWQRHIQVL
ncbi:MAG: hypothetical protein OEW00_12345, partial [candidate division Zixibacteria bacterium]|nr:hypothetical protein [candidate division Zixibacteria bacterium]